MNRIHVETYGRGKPVVLVHGWAMHTGIWRQFARRLAASHRVTCVDLPGHGLSDGIDSFTLPLVCERLAGQLPVQAAHWLGWSLGGTVALEMARRYPETVASVVLLASNPCFVSNHPWPGMPESVLDVFAEHLTIDCQATLLRFLTLQINGQAEFKALSRQLRQAVQACETPDRAVLSGALKVLKQADLRPVLAALDKPVTAILGARDTLVPVAAGAAMQALNPRLQLAVIDQAGHVPFLSHQQRLIEILDGFLAQR